MPVATSLPVWDLTPYFPGLPSTEFSLAVSKIESDITEAESTWESTGVTLAGAGDAEAIGKVLAVLEDLIEQAKLMANYLECVVTTDSTNDAAAAALSAFDSVRVRLGKLQTGFALWLRDLDIEQAIRTNEKAREHAFLLRHTKESSQHLMSPMLEALARDMGVSGSTSWQRLHSNLTSQIQVELDGQLLPMPAIRNVAYEADRSRRQRAYDAELEAWKKNELPIAASLNGIKGEVSTLCKARGWTSPLAESVFQQNMDQATLEAMMSAASDSFPMFRRYLKAKARAIGTDRLAFYDLFAPVGKSTKSWEYQEACDFVAENFSAYSAKMGDFARRSFRENWIDAGPRPGKVGGAYCSETRDDESRILMNFDPSYGSVSTLAHELGHGYHNLCLSRQSILNRESPATLAETASIFCETIIKEAALNSMGTADQLVILEASLQGQCQVVVDITSRYLFESEVFAKRSERDLASSEFSELMLDAQRKTYGDGLDPEKLHPYMWAVKPHYYSTYSFYNFPYMFGLLFGLGLYAIYQSEPTGFHDRYDELLSSTGLADAATLADRFGIDIRQKEFWAASLAQIEKDVEKFESLV